MTCKRFLECGLLGAIVLHSLIATTATAATYSYTGNNYDNFPTGISYDTSMFVSLTITLTSAIAPNSTNFNATPGIVSVSVFDGVLDFDPLSFFFVEFLVSTDGSGQIVNWSLDLGSPGLFVDSCNAGSTVLPPFMNPCGAVTGDYLATPLGSPSSSQPGSWSLIPEPSSAVLITIGLAGLAWRKPAESVEVSSEPIRGSSL